MNWRRLTVEGREYRWRGRSFFIIQNDAGQRIAGADGWAIKNALEPGVNSPDTWERGHWKKTVDGMVRPAEIAAFIRQTLGLGPSKSQFSY